MAEYRLHLLAGERLMPAQAFTAADDAVAILLAEDALEGLAAELWCGGRLVRRFERRSS